MQNGSGMNDNIRNITDKVKQTFRYVKGEAGTEEGLSKGPTAS